MQNSNISKVQEKIQTSLKKDYGWNIEEIKLAGAGVENAVFFVQESERGTFAVRSPFPIGEKTENMKESGRLSLKKEYEINKHCSLHGLPVPRVHALHIGDDIDYLVSEFIIGDQLPIPSDTIGKFTSKIHQIPIDGLVIPNQGSQKLSSYIANRLSRRIVSLRTNGIPAAALPQTKELQQILSMDCSKDCLLHLDVRPANLIGRSGAILAIYDWDNALFGSPALELARIFECRELNEEEFLNGYAESAVLGQTPLAVQLLYRLDAALMLAILFVFDLKKREKGEFYLLRIHTLMNELKRVL